jgi:hypothetical protein
MAYWRRWHFMRSKSANIIKIDIDKWALIIKAAETLNQK